MLIYRSSGEREGYWWQIENIFSFLYSFVCIQQFQILIIVVDPGDYAVRLYSPILLLKWFYLVSAESRPWSYDMGRESSHFVIRRKMSKEPQIPTWPLHCRGTKPKPVATSLQTSNCISKIIISLFQPLEVEFSTTGSKVHSYLNTPYLNVISLSQTR